MEAAEPNKYISFQGQLSDSTGARINGNVSATFKLWSVPAGGTALWTEAQTLAADNGITSATLGSVTGLTLPFDTQYWLGVTVGTDAEMSPRIRLAASPYAFTAYSLTDSALARGTLTVADTAVINGWVGIGTASPAARLDVAGGSSVGGEAALIGGPLGVGKGGVVGGRLSLFSTTGRQLTLEMSDTNDAVISNSFGKIRVTPVTDFIVSDTLLVVNKQNGRVGIGTASPAQNLDVAGTVQATAFVGDGSGLTGLSTSAAPDTDWTVDGSGNVYRTTGNVGIGTASPSDSLHVMGRIRMDGGPDDQMIDFIKSGTIGSSSSPDTFRIHGAGGIHLRTFGSSWADRMNITSTGNVGIGDTTPGAKLRVAGDVSVSDSLVVGDTRLVVLKSGNVGIGTAASAYPLDVQNSVSAGAAWPQLRLTNTADYISGVSLVRSSGAAGGEWVVSRSNSAGAGGSQPDAFTIGVNGVGNYLSITTAGNVGVGTQSPANILSVAGNSNFAGNVGIGTTAPGDSLHVSGRIQMDTNAATSAADGAMRWSGSDFEGRKGGSWVSLTSVGTVSPSSLSSAITSDSIAADAVTSAKILDGTIANADLASGSFPSVTSVGTLGSLTVSGVSSFSDSLIVSDTALVVNKQSGKVGVGTASPNIGSFTGVEISAPAAGLALTSTDGGGRRFIIGSTTGNAGLYVRDETAGSYRMMLADSGSLGIGTIGPDRMLDVLDAGNPQVRLTQADATAYADLHMRSTGDLVINVDGVADQLVLDNGGNVGIGTTSPGDSLHVNGTLRVEDTMVVGDTWLVVDKSAKVGVGTASPSEQLHVKGTSHNRLKVEGGTGSSVGMNMVEGANSSFVQVENGNRMGFYSGDQTTADMVLTYGGNLGIGTGTPSDSLHVVGRARISDTLTVGDSYIVAGPAGVGIRNLSPSGILDIRTGNEYELRFSGNFIANINHANAGTPMFVSTNGAQLSLGSNTDAEHLNILNGNVGIGTTAPGDSLHVNGTLRVEDTMVVGDTWLVVDKNGNVGVGTTTPLGNLTVASSGATRELMVLRRNDSTTKWSIGNITSNFNLYGFTGATSASTDLKLAVTSAGNVGIATAAPADSLTVNGSFTADSPTLVVHSGNDRVGVRTDNPRAPVEIKNGVLGWQDHVLLSGSSTGTAYWIGRNDDEDGTAEPTDRLAFGTGTTAGTNAAMHISSNGNISIGDTPAPEKLAVFGSMMVDSPTFYVDAVNNRVGIGTSAPDTDFSVNGEASKSGGGTWNTFSDVRLKDIKGQFAAGSEALMKIHPVRYSYRKDNGAGLRDHSEKVGLIAQEVAEAIPDAVYSNNQGYLMLKSDPIIWAMLNAIKEQQVRMDAQSVEIEALKEEIGVLKRGNE
ncbi:tail fiber domain-containing protein [bacterium]|nr:tail fiber domain-containing protein [bacterium]